MCYSYKRLLLKEVTDVEQKLADFRSIVKQIKPNNPLAKNSQTKIFRRVDKFVSDYKTAFDNGTVSKGADPFEVEKEFRALRDSGYKLLRLNEADLYTINELS